MFRSVFARRTSAFALAGASAAAAFSSTTYCEEKFATSFDKKEFKPFKVAFTEAISKDSKVLILDTPDQEPTDVSSFLLFKVPGCGKA